MVLYSRLYCSGDGTAILNNVCHHIGFDEWQVCQLPLRKLEEGFSLQYIPSYYEQQTLHACKMVRTTILGHAILTSSSGRVSVLHVHMQVCILCSAMLHSLQLNTEVNTNVMALYVPSLLSCLGLLKVPTEFRHFHLPTLIHLPSRGERAEGVLFCVVYKLACRKEETASLSRTYW